MVRAGGRDGNVSPDDLGDALRLGTLTREGGCIVVVDAEGNPRASIADGAALVVEVDRLGRNRLVPYRHDNPAHVAQLAQTQLAPVELDEEGKPKKAAAKLTAAKPKAKAAHPDDWEISDG